MQKQAISYARFSSTKQKDGDSENRQADLYAQFCREHHLTPTTAMIDRGYSGFHGVHRSKGHFGRFLIAVKAGEIAKGTVLVVESWDRFSRERIDVSFATVCEILRSGIEIGVCDLFEIFSDKDVGSSKINMIFNDLQRSWRESKRKSDMGIRNQAKRRETGKKINGSVKS